jgi:nicotinamidase-related amidase
MSETKKPIVPKVIEYVDAASKDENTLIFFTQDTHYDEEYLNTQEGKLLPVKHCLAGEHGWKIIDGLQKYIVIEDDRRNVVRKDAFGSKYLYTFMSDYFDDDKIEQIDIVGLCTDICVISNAMILKSEYPEAKIIVHSSMCAGVTPESHERALEAMKACQIFVEE